MKFISLIYFFLMLMTSSAFSAGYYNSFFGKNKEKKLQFTTTSQSVVAQTCSGSVTIRNMVGNTPTNVSSLVIISLSGTGLTFYMDAECTQNATTMAFTPGSNSTTFYFTGSAASTPIVTASATGYSSITQNETITSNPFIWTGSGGDTNWTTAANWSGGTVPGTSDVAVFNNTCSVAAACVVSINASINVNGVRLISGFGGNISQGSTSTINLGSKGWVQTGSAFSGSNQNISLNGSFVVGGGTFTSTSGTLLQTGSLWSIYNLAIFNHNSGTIQIHSNCYFAHMNGSYRNVRLGGFNNTYNLNSSTINISGTLTLDSTSNSPISQINSGTLYVSGNVILENNGAVGSAIVRLSGNAAGQSVTGSPSGQIPNLVIAAGTNAVTLSGNITVGNYTMTSAGTFTATGSTLTIANGGTITPGTKNYNNVVLGGFAVTYNLGGGTFNVLGDLTLNSPTSSPVSTVTNGTIRVSGSVLASNYGLLGNATVQMISSATTGRTITSTSSSVNLPSLVINTGTNNLSLIGTMLLGSYTVSSVGTLTSTAATVKFVQTGTISPGATSLHNVIFTGYTSVYTISGSLTVTGNLILDSETSSPAVAINSGNIQLMGNLIATRYGAIGDTEIVFAGSIDQHISQSPGSNLPGIVSTFSTSGNLILDTNVNWNAGITVLNGTINMSGYNLTLQGLDLFGNTLNKGNGVLTVSGGVAGTGSIYGGTVNP